MKHILNNLSEEEKNNIREQHAGGMKVVNENFNKLINSKLGDVKPLVNESIIKEGLTAEILSTVGIGALVFVIHKFKKLLDKFGLFIPSASLIMFVDKIKEIEEGKSDNKVIIEEKDNYVFISIITPEGEVFDSLTVDVEDDSIYKGTDAHSGKKPSWKDRIIPMNLPADTDTTHLEVVELAEEKLVSRILEIIDRHRQSEGR